MCLNDQQQFMMIFLFLIEMLCLVASKATMNLTLRPPIHRKHIPCSLMRCFFIFLWKTTSFGQVPTLRRNVMCVLSCFSHKMAQGVHPANLSNPVRNVGLPPPISGFFSTLPPCSADVSRAREVCMRVLVRSKLGSKKSQKHHFDFLLANFYLPNPHA